MAKKKNEANEIAGLFKKLQNADAKKFPAKREVMDAPKPKDQGVYLIENEIGEVLHVGRTLGGKGGLHQRLKNHLSGTSSFMKNYEKIDCDELRKKCHFRYITVRCPRKRALLEACAIGHLCPKHIGTGEKRA